MFCPPELCPHRSADGSGLYEIALHVRVSAGQCYILAFHSEIPTSRLYQLNNCPTHSLDNVLADARHRSQLTTKTRQNYLFSTYRILKIPVFLFDNRPLRHLTRAFIVQLSHKGRCSARNRLPLRPVLSLLSQVHTASSSSRLVPASQNTSS